MAFGLQALGRSAAPKAAVDARAASNVEQPGPRPELSLTLRRLGTGAPGSAQAEAEAQAEAACGRRARALRSARSPHPPRHRRRRRPTSRRLLRRATSRRPGRPHPRRRARRSHRATSTALATPKAREPRERSDGQTRHALGDAASVLAVASLVGRRSDRRAACSAVSFAASRRRARSRTRQPSPPPGFGSSCRRAGRGAGRRRWPASIGPSGCATRLPGCAQGSSCCRRLHRRCCRWVSTLLARPRPSSWARAGRRGATRWRARTRSRRSSTPHRPQGHRDGRLPRSVRQRRRARVQAARGRPDGSRSAPSGA